jgi:hypothetical protein
VFDEKDKQSLAFSRGAKASLLAKCREKLEQLLSPENAQARTL